MKVIVTELSAAQMSELFANPAKFIAELERETQPSKPEVPTFPRIEMAAFNEAGDLLETAYLARDEFVAMCNAAMDKIENNPHLYDSPAIQALVLHDFGQLARDIDVLVGRAERIYRGWCDSFPG